ncbi:MAG: 30S ribosomal protein S9 [Phycisphaerales bacterium]|nr:30S ribosomal protein S9 [Phycisphaerales bacterium]
MSETITTTAKTVYAKGPDARGWWWATGRRKCAVARVRIKSGAGEFLVNGRPLEEYLVIERDLKSVLAVLDKASQRNKVDVRARVVGGGVTGHTGAIIMGLGRALSGFDASLEKLMRDSGFLTRDSREVERKKPGQPGARRRFQFSKR